MAIEPIQRGFTAQAKLGTTITLEGVLYIKTLLGEVQVDLSTNQTLMFWDEEGVNDR